jgi:hypothetical protein
MRWLEGGIIPFWRLRIAAISGLMAFAVATTTLPAFATGPFSSFTGSWSGTGTLRPANGAAERIRCNAHYRPRGSTGHEVDLQLRCASDSYNFDLSGRFQVDDLSQISGQWTEHTRSVGGTASGLARGDRVQLHIESAGFAATLLMLTSSQRQSVSIDSQAAGQVVKASITLNRG